MWTTPREEKRQGQATADLPASRFLPLTLVFSPKQ
jgi:hypothetical protein